MMNDLECTEEEEIIKTVRSNKSDEIECQLGYFMETNRRIHQRRLSSKINDSFRKHDSCETSVRIWDEKHLDLESREISVLNLSELNTHQGTSWLAATLIMTNCTIGMGLLNYPYAILSCGSILLAMTTQMIIITFIIVSLTMMCYVSRFYGDVSFQGVVGSHLGKIARVICQILIFINNFATLVVYLVVIGDQLEHAGEAIWSPNVSAMWATDRRFILTIVSIVLIFPLCLLKRFDIFKYTSFLGVIAALYVSFGLILINYFKGNYKAIETEEKVHISNLVSIVPLTCFTFECHIEIPPMVACLKKSNFWYYEKMIFGYVLLSSIIYSTAGVLGYLTFKGATPDNILTAYHPTDVLVIIAMILLSLKIITTYPVIFYCLRVVVEDYVNPLIMKNPKLKLWKSKINIFITIILFCSSVFVAIFVPSITSVINLIGGVSAAFIFIFPGMCYLKLYSSPRSKWNWKMIILGALYIVLGGSLAAMSTTREIMDYLD